LGWNYRFGQIRARKDTAMPLASKMLLQLAGRDIGQLTYIDSAWHGPRKLARTAYPPLIHGQTT
jgi:hypothetical protein